jgi:tyrosine-protein phosphatase SIW14
MAIVGVLFTCQSFAPCAAGQGAKAAERDSRWAVALERPGVGNLFRVSDDLYRGAQPTTEGFRGLQKLGIKTIVNLRAFHSDKKKLRGRGLSYERIRFVVWHPEREDVVRFLKIVNDPERTPVFIHCRRGADRTGMIAAIYRICVQGWSKRDAIDEMTRGGYGFAPVWSHLADYIEALDVEELRRQAGIPMPVPEPNVEPRAVKE